MKQVTLNIPDNKYRFFIELIESLKFVKVENKESIPQWQMDEVNKRLANHKKNPEMAMDFDTTMDDIEKDL
jgi:hypothetical protein